MLGEDPRPPVGGGDMSAQEALELAIEWYENQALDALNHEGNCLVNGELDHAEGHRRKATQCHQATDVLRSLAADVEAMTITLELFITRSVTEIYDYSDALYDDNIEPEPAGYYCYICHRELDTSEQAVHAPDCPVEQARQIVARMRK